MCAGAGCVVDLGRWLTTFGQEGVPGRPVGGVPLGFLVARLLGLGGQVGAGVGGPKVAA